MKINRMLTSAVACASLIGLAPAYAAENTAAVSRLSIAKIGGVNGMPSRAGTKLKKTNSIAAVGWVVGFIAVGGIIGGTIIASKKNFTPTSP